MNKAIRTVSATLSTLSFMASAERVHAVTIDSSVRTLELQADGGDIQSTTVSTIGPLSNTLLDEDDQGAVPYRIEATNDNGVALDGGTLVLSGNAIASAEKNDGALGNTYASASYEVLFTPETNALYHFDIVTVRIVDAFDPQDAIGSFYFTNLTTGEEILSQSKFTNGTSNLIRFPGELVAGNQYSVALNATANADAEDAGFVSAEFAVELTVTEVPEPGTAWLFVSGCVLLGRRCRRK